jgi:hypothetical protein
VKVRFKPKIQLDQIYKPDNIYISGASPHACSWLSQDPTFLKIITGVVLTISGDMANVCSSSISNSDGLHLLQDAGFAIPREIFRFRDSADYEGLLQSLCAKGRKIVVQHVHPLFEVAPEQCWISPSTLSFVNNKGNLARMIHAEDIPGRRIVKSSRIKEELSAAGFPWVIKAITNETSGCGADVMICRTEDEINLAEVYFQACPYVVIEEYIAMKRNLCLHFVIEREGDVTYLGCTEQVCDAKGKYDGNWIETGLPPPPEAVELGIKAAKEGYRRGYYGLVGTDMAVLENGRVLIFDLNFRINGSTPALLLYESIRRELGKTVMRLRTIPCPGTYGKMLKGTYKAMEKGMLLPLISFDPEIDGDSAPRLRCLILGNTREEVFENERQLIDLGFVIWKSVEEKDS